MGQAAVSGTSIANLFTDTYLYRQDGAPHELIRAYANAVTRGGVSSTT